MTVLGTGTQRVDQPDDRSDRAARERAVDEAEAGAAEKAVAEEGGAPVAIPHSPEGAFVYVTKPTRANPVVSLRWSDGRAERFSMPSPPPVIPAPGPSRKVPATRDPSATTPPSPLQILPAPRPAEPSPSPVEPPPRERRDGST